MLWWSPRNKYCRTIDPFYISYPVICHVRPDIIQVLLTMIINFVVVGRLHKNGKTVRFCNQLPSLLHLLQGRTISEIMSLHATDELNFNNQTTYREIRSVLLNINMPYNKYQYIPTKGSIFFLILNNCTNKS